MKAASLSEDAIQAGIVEYLRTVLLDARVFAIPNGGLRSKREAAKLKWTGVLAGVPDLCIISPCGSAYFIEVKTLTGVLSPAQKEFNLWFLKNNVPYAVCRSVDDAAIAIERWRLNSREAA